MIYECYYKHIKNYQKNDGEAFMENTYAACQEKIGEQPTLSEQKIVKHVPNTKQGIKAKA